MYLRISIFIMFALLVVNNAFAAPCAGAGTLKQQYVCTRYVTIDGTNGSVVVDLANVTAVHWTVDKQTVTFYASGQAIAVKGNPSAADFIVYYRQFLSAHPEFLRQ